MPKVAEHETTELMTFCNRYTYTLLLETCRYVMMVKGDLNPVYLGLSDGYKPYKILLGFHREQNEQNASTQCY